MTDTGTTPNHPDLGAFRRAIEAGVPMVMVALASYTRLDPGRQAVFSPTVMRLLRDTYGFQDVIVADDIGGAVAISDIPPATRAIEFLRAGGDLIVSKFVEPAALMAGAVLAMTGSDPSFRSRVDQAVVRVLSAKESSGLLDCEP